MSNFFANCRTIEDLKEAYFSAAKKHHPDNGGDAEMFKKISADYHDMFPYLKNKHRKNTENSSDNKSDFYERKSTQAETHETPEMFIDIVDKLFKFDDINIEVRGSWLWITGNTFPIRNELKELGCRWSKYQKSWYWTAEPYTRKRNKMSVQAQRMYFGSYYMEEQEKPLRLQG